MSMQTDRSPSIFEASPETLELARKNVAQRYLKEGWTREEFGIILQALGLDGTARAVANPWHIPTPTTFN